MQRVTNKLGKRVLNLKNNLGFTNIQAFENCYCGDGCLHCYQCLAVKQTHGCLKKLQLRLDRFMFEVSNTKYIFVS